MAFEKDLNLEATELRLGLPGTSPDDQSSPINRIISNKRALPSDDQNPPESGRDDNSDLTKSAQENPPPTKAQVVGWPPVRSFRKNCFQAKKKDEVAAAATAAGGMFIKVSMDGAPFLRKVDLKTYQGYPELLQALENMFKFSLGKFCEREGYNGSEFVPTYEDKDGDWMLVGDVPWEMFMGSCKKLRIMKGSEAKGLSCGSV
ncbi:auxin-induced protein 22D-like [Cucurbita pepo subsp. pepo]|uniref:auxin-induced protein 22D-like n=1 Tax=Cucurbita pepo subsp. pepo TaxID=3664 RepID=UPI000C9D4165|nr:auxin-induced protein 22D-like [Cucurbita pepo subsp. pepo]